MYSNSLLLVLVFTLTLLSLCKSFVIKHGSRYGYLEKQDVHVLKSSSNDGDDSSSKPAKFTFGALVQLVTMGAGAPSLGEFDRMDENGKMFFKLEANNFADNEGNSKQTKAKYFLDGYVEDDGDDKPPGFFENLISGGQKQTDWETRMKKKNNEHGLMKIDSNLLYLEVLFFVMRISVKILLKKEISSF